MPDEYVRKELSPVKIVKLIRLLLQFMAYSDKVNLR